MDYGKLLIATGSLYMKTAYTLKKHVSRTASDLQVRKPTKDLKQSMTRLLECHIP